MKRESSTSPVNRRLDKPQTDRGWAWVVLGASMMTCFLIIGYIKSYGLFIVEFQNVYQCSASMTSTLQGIQSAVNSISATIALIWGVERLSCRQLVIISGCTFCIGYVIGSIAPSIEFMILSHGILLGIGMGIAMGPSIVITGQYFRRWRGLAMGLSMSGGAIGGVVLPFVLRYLFDEYGLHGTLLISGGIMLNLVIFGGVMRPTYVSDRIMNSVEDMALLQQTNNHGDPGEILRQNKTLSTFSELECKRLSNASMQNGVSVSLSSCAISYSDISATKHEPNDLKCAMISSNAEQHNSEYIKLDNTKLTSFGEIWVLMTNKPLWLMIFSSALVTTGCFLIGVYIPPHAESLNISSEKLSLLASIAGGTDLVGRVVCSFIADTGWMERYNMIALSTIITGLVSLFTPFYTDFETMVLFASTYGVFGGIYFVLFAVVLLDFVGLEKHPVALGIIYLVQGVSVSVAMPILGFVCDVTGSYVAVFYIMGISLILGGIILLFSPVAQKLEANIKSAPHTSVTVAEDKTV